MSSVKKSLKHTISENLIQRIPHRDKTYFIRDDQLRGFGLKILPSPSKQINFIVEARLGGTGKSIRRSIGSTFLLSAKDARKTAEDYLQKIHNDIDPKKRIPDKVPTPSELLESHIKAKQLREKTAKDYRQSMKTTLAKFANKPVDQITAISIEKWYLKGKQKPRATDIAFSVLKTTLERAKSLNYIEENPASKASQLFKRYPVKKRGLVLHAEKLEKFLSSFFHLNQTASLNETMRDWILLKLITGARSNESKLLLWKNVDWKNEWFTMHETKNGIPLTIPMTKITGQMLKNRKAAKNKNNGYVFQNKNGTGPMVDPRKTLKKITDHAHIEPIRPHDLRHTFSHIAKYEANMSEGEVGKFLNHKESITDSYIGHHHAKQKKQLSTIENYLSQLIIIDEKKPKERFQGLFLHFFYGNDDDYMPAANLKEDKPFEDYLV